MYTLCRDVCCYLSECCGLAMNTSISTCVIGASLDVFEQSEDAIELVLSSNSYIPWYLLLLFAYNSRKHRTYHKIAKKRNSGSKYICIIFLSFRTRFSNYHTNIP